MREGWPSYNNLETAPTESIPKYFESWVVSQPTKEGCGAQGGGSLIDIVDAVNSAFASYDPDTLEQVWRALFSVQESVLEHEGGNDFAVPHEGARNDWADRNDGGGASREPPIPVKGTQHSGGLRDDLNDGI